MNISLKIKEKRSLVLLAYYPILYLAFHISAISYSTSTIFLLLGIACSILLYYIKNTSIKDIILSLILGLCLFFLGMFLYKM